MTAAGEQGDDTIFVERPGGFEQIPDALWQGGAVSPQSVVTYMALSKAGSREDRGFPGRRRLAADMGVSSLRTVDARLDELVEKGWLLITPRYRKGGDGGQTSNHYRLLWHPLQDANDPRYLKWKAEVTEFEAVMAARVAANVDARGEDGPQVIRRGDVRRVTWTAPEAEPAVASPAAQTPVQNPARGGSNILLGGGAESCTGPAQNPAPQERDLSLPTPLLTQTKTLPAGKPPDAAAIQPSLVALPGGADGETATAKAPRRKTRLPDDWWPDEGLRAWAEAKATDGRGRLLLQLGHETETFQAWHRANGSVMLSWDQAYRTWILKAVERAQRGGPGRNGKPAGNVHVSAQPDEVRARQAAVFDGRR